MHQEPHPPRQLLADLSLLLAVAVWGVTFVLVKDAVERWPPWTFNAVRFWIAFAAFVPLLVWDARAAASRTAGSGGTLRAHLRPGAWAGVALIAGYALQTFGLRLTTPARAGFLTGVSVVLVPLGARLLGHRVLPSAVAGVALALLGVVAMHGGAGVSVGAGELLVLGCAVAFAAHILIVGAFAPRCRPIPFAAAQVLVTALGCTAAAVAFEVLPYGMPSLDAQVAVALAFTGVLATTLCFWIQSAAQRHTSAVHTALIFSLEPAAAAAVSHALGREVLTPATIAGGALILAGTLVAEVGASLRAARAAAVREPE